MSTLGPSLADLIHRVDERSPGAPPLEQLELAVATAGDLEAVADQLLGHFVDAARASGASWAEIGSVLGVSKQGAQQRFVPRSADLPEFTKSAEYNRWTPRARGVLTKATEEAGRLGQSYVGTEHLLLGICAGDNLAVTALDTLGVNALDVTKELIARIGKHRTVSSEGLPFTPLAMRALELSLREALRLGHNYIGTEHLLLALASGDGMAGEVLRELGVNPDPLRRAVIHLLTRYR